MPTSGSVLPARKGSETGSQTRSYGKRPLSFLPVRCNRPKDHQHPQSPDTIHFLHRIQAQFAAKHHLCSVFLKSCRARCFRFPARNSSRCRARCQTVPARILPASVALPGKRVPVHICGCSRDGSGRCVSAPAPVVSAGALFLGHLRLRWHCLDVRQLCLPLRWHCLDVRRLCLRLCWHCLGQKQPGCQIPLRQVGLACSACPVCLKRLAL